MKRRLLATLFMSAAALAVALPAQAEVSGEGTFHEPSSQVEQRPAIADFEGTKIDLAKGWGDAKACIVARDAGVLECYRSEQALESRASTLGGAPDSVTASCSSPLRLYEHGSYGGRLLQFYDRGYWQNMADYGFDNQLSSYITGNCYAHLAENTNGGGFWYPGDTGPNHGEPLLSAGWNDRVSSIKID